MARPKKEKPKREAPIQFRPGSELGHRVRGFAETHGLQPPEACRLLVCLAIAEMDCRYAGLILPLAEVMGGENAYVRACEHVHTALQAARRATDAPVQLDPSRARFIEETVKVALTERGAADRFRPLAFLPVEEAPALQEEERSRTKTHTGGRRKVRAGSMADDQELEQPAAEQKEQATEDEPGWTSTGDQGDERVPVRP